jgi:hypothetical protein
MHVAARLCLPIIAGVTMAGSAAAAPPDQLPLGDLAPIAASDLAAGAGFNSMSFSMMSGGAGTTTLSSESSVTGAITHSPASVAGGIATGSIDGFSTAAGSGISSIQLSTGINNLQQNSISVVMVFGS